MLCASTRSSTYVAGAFHSCEEVGISRFAASSAYDAFHLDIYIEALILWHFSTGLGMKLVGKHWFWNETW